jgi:hypothetical protein
MMEDLIPNVTTETELDRIRVETALSRFPIHALTGTKVGIDIQNLGTATKWKISYNSEYGQPGQLAYKLDTLIVNRRIEEQGRTIPKVIRLGTLQEISLEVSPNRKPANRNEVKRALKQNSYTTIEAKISYKTKDGAIREIEFGDSRYAIIFTGEKFPDGRKADAVYIILHDIYRDILNSAQTRPLDYAYMKALPPMAQRFYEIISYHIFACLHYRNQTCKMRYSEFCKLSTATRYFLSRQMKKQMATVHAPHIKSGYIEPKITYQPITDEENKADWLMIYTPGRNAGRQYTEFVSVPKKQGTIEGEEGQIVLPFWDDIERPFDVAPIKTLPQITNNASSEIPEVRSTDPNPATLALRDRLVQAGMSRGEALTQASTNAEECERQLEYLPFTEVKTTPGAYLASAIKGGFAPPKAYLEAKTKQEEAEKKRKAQEALAMRAEAEQARKEAEIKGLDAEIFSLEAEHPEEFLLFETFVSEKREEDRKKNSKFSVSIQDRMKKNFETIEKRRELYQLWKVGKATPPNTP